MDNIKEPDDTFDFKLKMTSMKGTGEIQMTSSVLSPVPFKYNEERLLEELRTYLSNTYGSHYVGKNNVQSLDLIESSGHGEGFCIGSILKYASRFGKKKGKNRDDLLKIIHYALFEMYLLDKEKV